MREPGRPEDHARAARKDPAVASGLNIVGGRVTYADLATQYRKPLATLAEVL